MGLHALPEVGEPHGGDCTAAFTRRGVALREVLLEALEALAVRSAAPEVGVAHRQEALRLAGQRGGPSSGPASPPGTMLPSGSGPAAGAARTLPTASTTMSTMPTTTRASRRSTAAITRPRQAGLGAPDGGDLGHLTRFGLPRDRVAVLDPVAALDVTGERDGQLGLGRLQQRTGSRVGVRALGQVERPLDHERVTLAGDREVAGRPRR